MLHDLVTLGFLILLQAVLGFDNLLYISLESKRAPESDRKQVRRLGIGIAIGLRIVLLFALVKLIEYVQDPIGHLDTRFLHIEPNIHSLIVLGGGVFIIYTAMKEIWHMLAPASHEDRDLSPKSARQVMTMIVLMNLIFSFDSILSAMALTKTFWVMAAAIVISGVMMMWLSDGVSRFLERNRMYEVLGLFVLFVVGIMLLTEGGHLAHMRLFGSEVTAMSKTTFYFVIAVLVLTDIVQSRYQKRLLAETKPARA